MKLKTLPLNASNLANINCKYEASNEFDLEITIGITHRSEGRFDYYEYYGYIKNGVDGFNEIGSITPNNINGYKFNMFQSQYNIEDVGAELNVGNDYLGMKYKYIDVTMTNPENPSESHTYRLENGWIDSYWSYNDRCISFWFNDRDTKNYFTGRYGSHKLPSNTSKVHIVGIPLDFECVLTEINPPYGTVVTQSGTNCRWYLNSPSSFEIKPSGDITITNLVDRRNGGPGYIEFTVANNPNSNYAPWIELTVDGHTYYVYYPRK